MSNQETKTLNMSWELPHPPEKVWRALTETDLLAKWIMSNDMKPIVGHKFTFKTQATQWWDGIVNCEVLEAEKGKRLKYTWRGGAVNTLVTWTLTATKSGTLLAIEQSGFSGDAMHAFGGAKVGWERNVETLGRLLSEI